MKNSGRVASDSREMPHNLDARLDRTESLGFLAMLSVAGLGLTYIVRLFGMSYPSIEPMYIPLLIAGVVLSPAYAVAAGLAIPALTSGITGFPLPPDALVKMAELGVCAFAISFLWKSFRFEETMKANAAGIIFSWIGILAGLLVSAIFSVIRTDVGSFGYYLTTSLTSGGIAFLIYGAILSPLAIRIKLAVLQSMSAKSR